MKFPQQSNAPAAAIVVAGVKGMKRRCLAASLVCALAVGSTASATATIAGHAERSRAAQALRSSARMTPANVARALSKRAHLPLYFPPRQDASHAPAPDRPPTTRAVTSCADDGSPGTLRSVVAGSVDGDTIDLTALTCSTITLQTGVIVSDVNSLTLIGPGADRLAIDGNHADRVIAGLNLTLQSLTIANGRNIVPEGYGAAGGGCIVAGANLSLIDSVVTGCESEGDSAFGGATYAKYMSEVRNTVLTGNTASATRYSAFGGAIFVLAYANLTDSTVSGNRAVGASPTPFYSYGFGGGVVTNPNGGYGSTVRDSTISGNSADFGGAWAVSEQNAYYATPTVFIGSTISGNEAGKGTGGIALISSLQVTNSTIAFNSGGEEGSGGIVFGDVNGNYTTYLNLQSSIVADNTNASPDYGKDIGSYDGASISGANNIVIGSTLPLPTDTLAVDPKLMPLADNGGPTQTHALGADSPAIDAGANPTNLPFDQRGDGFPRVVGTRADIGSFESASGSGDGIFASGFDSP